MVSSTAIGLIILNLNLCLSFVPLVVVSSRTAYHRPNFYSVDPSVSDDWFKSELVDENEDDEEEELDWIPDRDKARMKRQFARDYYANEQAGQTDRVTQLKEDVGDGNINNKPVYTEEEEELIQAMGGKKGAPTKREPGYLGDSTLSEIAQDYSVPVCYLADVLCMWGVPVPININERLGDLVLGEQAFAILEAINSLDVAALHDRYSNTNLIDLCDHHDIDIKEGFQMAVKEGWSLPFGVRTILRVEQEEELLRVLGAII